MAEITALTDLALLSQFTESIEHRRNVGHSLRDAVTVIRVVTALSNTHCVIQDLPQGAITCNKTASTLCYIYLHQILCICYKMSVVAQYWITEMN